MRLIKVLFALVVCAGLVGCGGGPEDTVSGDVAPIEEVPQEENMEMQLD